MDIVDLFYTPSIICPIIQSQSLHNIYYATLCVCGDEKSEWYELAPFFLNLKMKLK